MDKSLETRIEQYEHTLSRQQELIGQITVGIVDDELRTLYEEALNKIEGDIEQQTSDPLLEEAYRQLLEESHIGIEQLGKLEGLLNDEVIEKKREDFLKRAHRASEYLLKIIDENNNEEQESTSSQRDIVLPEIPDIKSTTTDSIEKLDVPIPTFEEATQLVGFLQIHKDFLQNRLKVTPIDQSISDQLLKMVPSPEATPEPEEIEKLRSSAINKFRAIVTDNDTFFKVVDELDESDPRLRLINELLSNDYNKEEWEAVMLVLNSDRRVITNGEIDRRKGGIVVDGSIREYTGPNGRILQYGEEPRISVDEYILDTFKEQHVILSQATIERPDYEPSEIPALKQTEEVVIDLREPSEFPALKLESEPKSVEQDSKPNRVIDLTNLESTQLTEKKLIKDKVEEVAKKIVESNVKSGSKRAAWLSGGLTFMTQVHTASARENGIGPKSKKVAKGYSTRNVIEIALHADRDMRPLTVRHKKFVKQLITSSLEKIKQEIKLSKAIK